MYSAVNFDLPVDLVCEFPKGLLGNFIVCEKVLCGLHQHVLNLEKMLNVEVCCREPEFAVSVPTSNSKSLRDK